MRKELLDKIINKKTNKEVCNHYCNKFVKEVIAEIGEPLRVKYVEGGSFTHETVLAVDEDDYGYWVETTNKLWKFDYV